jgi:hypothetical protein
MPLLLPAKRTTEVTGEDGLRGGSDEEDGGCGIDGSRKKLRLSKDQSAVLEDSFREHPTLNPVSTSSIVVAASIKSYSSVVHPPGRSPRLLMDERTARLGSSSFQSFAGSRPYQPACDCDCDCELY